MVELVWPIQHVLCNSYFITIFLFSSILRRLRNGIQSSSPKICIISISTIWCKRWRMNGNCWASRNGWKGSYLRDSRIGLCSPCFAPDILVYVFRSPYVTTEMIIRVIALFEVVNFSDEGCKTIITQFEGSSYERPWASRPCNIFFWRTSERRFSGQGRSGCIWFVANSNFVALSCLSIFIMPDIVLQRAAQIIENLTSNRQWQNEDFVIAMRKIGDEIGGVKPKVVLKILRQALTGMKVCIIYIISRILL